MTSRTGIARTDTTRADLYARVTGRIVADLEQGVRPWFKPWSAGHTAGRITRPLRHNGTPYCGINVLLLWSEAMARGFTAPLWMTFRQALQLGAHVRKDETGSLVVYADRITKTETDEKGEDVERSIPFLKGYTVFNVEQIDGLPALYTAPAAPRPRPRFPYRHRREFRCCNRHRHSPWRQSGLLLRHLRPCAVAAIRGLPRRGKLLRHRPA